jgi:hypothetical protein
MDDRGKRTFIRRPATKSADMDDHRQTDRGSPPSTLPPDTDQPDPRLCRIRDERDQLRLVLQMVLDVSVFDGAGRSVTVETMLRGYLATKVRIALGAKRSE